MRRLLLAIAMTIGLVVGSAHGQEISLRRAFVSCVAQAAELGMLAEMLALAEPAGTRSATFLCSGRPAQDLFMAMESVSNQTAYGETVIRSSGHGVRCLRLPTDNANCVVNIQAEAAFLDALRRR